MKVINVYIKRVSDVVYIQKILLTNFINISTKFKIIQKITNIFIIKNFSVKNKS